MRAFVSVLQLFESWNRGRTLCVVWCAADIRINVIERDPSLGNKVRGIHIKKAV